MAERSGIRWVPVECKAHDRPIVHGFTRGALIVIAERAQEGDFITTLGNAACFVPAVEENLQKSTGKRGSREVAYAWKLENQ